MNLDHVAAVIRPRTYPEAVDLGFRMLRAWCRPIVGAWAVVGLPLFAIAAATLYRWPGAVFLLIWWIKPVFACVPVFVLGRGLFGALPSTADTLRAWPRQLRTGMLASLTWLRFDPLRSLRAPVQQLEGLPGVAGRRRFRLLSREVRLDATLLTVTCSMFELCLFAGLLALVLTFHVPLQVVDLLDGRGLHLTLPQQWTLVVFYLLAVGFVEPFYAAGGFGLYVNRRTLLEGWDLEVVFRRMASRLRSARKPAAAISVALVLGLAVGAPAADLPEASGVSPGAGADPGEVILEVLADPVFGVETTESHWVFRPRETTAPADPLGARFGLFLGAVFRALAWILAAAGLVWGTVQLVRRARQPAGASRHGPEGPPATVELLGLDVRERSLPEDVAGRARELWDAGNRRGAFRLLYRGALSRLIAHDHLPLGPGATEGDCVRIAGHDLSRERLAYFRSLTTAWQLVAYGQRAPDEARGRELIGDWDTHFRSTR